MDKVPSQKELDERYNMEGATLKQKMGLRAVRWAEKVAVKKAKKEIGKLFERHQGEMNYLLGECEDVVMKEEDEKKHPQMVAMVCTSLIAGFDTYQEQRLVLQMVEETLKNYNKEVNKNGFNTSTKG